jgi:hypothetical protein
MTEWIAFAFRANQIDRARAAEIGIEETQLEVDRGFSAAGLNHRLSHHATRPEAETAARDMLDRLRAGSPSIPWRACFANPHVDGHGSGRCYSIDAREL